MQSAKCVCMDAHENIEAKFMSSDNDTKKRHDIIIAALERPADNYKKCGYILPNELIVSFAITMMLVILKLYKRCMGS